MVGKIVSGALVGVFSLTICSQLYAQEDIVKKRKDLMQSSNAAVKALTKAAEGQDFATVEIKAREIMGNTDNTLALFPKGSLTDKSRGHADIWDKWDEFGKRNDDTKKAASALAKAAVAKDEGGVATQLKALGNVKSGTCGECHKAFRADFRKAN